MCLTDVARDLAAQRGHPRSKVRSLRRGNESVGPGAAVRDRRNPARGKTLRDANDPEAMHTAALSALVCKTSRPQGMGRGPCDEDAARNAVAASGIRHDHVRLESAFPAMGPSLKRLRRLH